MRPLDSYSRNISLVILPGPLADAPAASISESALSQGTGFGGADRIWCREPRSRGRRTSAMARARETPKPSTCRPATPQPPACLSRRSLARSGGFPMQFIGLPAYSRNFTT